MTGRRHTVGRTVSILANPLPVSCVLVKRVLVHRRSASITKVGATAGAAVAAVGRP